MTLPLGCQGEGLFFHLGTNSGQAKQPGSDQQHDGGFGDRTKFQIINANSCINGISYHHFFYNVTSDNAKGKIGMRNGDVYVFMRYTRDRVMVIQSIPNVKN